MSDMIINPAPAPVRDWTVINLENDLGVIVEAHLLHARDETTDLTAAEQQYLQQAFGRAYPVRTPGHTYRIYCNRDLHRTAASPGDLRVSSMGPA